jgi:uncharacterized protein with PQ loop repeat
MNTLTFIAVCAVVLTIIHSIPQAIKVYLSSLPKAISGFSVVFMLFGSLSWALYGYNTGINAVTIAYSFLFVFNVLILVFMLKKSGVNKRRIALVSTLLTGLLIAILAYLPAEALGYFGGVVTALMAIPQGFKLIRQREAAGVSGLTYLFLAASSICWVIYGHLTENLLLVLPNLLIFPTAALVYFHVIKYRSANFWYYKNLSAPHAIK